MIDAYTSFEGSSAGSAGLSDSDDAFERVSKEIPLSPVLISPSHSQADIHKFSLPLSFSLCSRKNESKGILGLVSQVHLQLQPMQRTIRGSNSGLLQTQLMACRSP